MNLSIFFTLSLMATLSCAIVEVFCVADYSLSNGPSGYSCKDLAKVTLDNFVFNGLNVPGNTSNIYSSVVTPAFSSEFSAFNGFGLAMARLDFAVGGVVALHVHCTSKVLILTQGEIVAGLIISTNNIAYFKKLKVGDVMVFPESLLHFQVNVGKTLILAFVTLNSVKPGLQFIDNFFFAGNLPSWLIEKIMFLSYTETVRLKKAFNGKRN